MYDQPILRLVAYFAQHLGHDVNPSVLRQIALEPGTLTQLDPERLAARLNDLGEPIGLTFVYSRVPCTQLEDVLRAAALPVIVYLGAEIQPVLVTQSRLGRVTYMQFGNEDENHTVDLDEFLRRAREANRVLHSDPNDVFDADSLPLINGLAVAGMFSDAPGEEHQHPTPLQRFLRLVAIERKEIAYIYIYAIAVGLFSLVLPVAMNTIVQLISGGLLLEPAILLILLVPVAVLISGGLQILQISIVETLQQRIFTRAAFEFAFRIPKVRLERIRSDYAPELMNRFFDILTIQKGFAKIFTEFLTALLQIVFGLLLLAFYHPFFIFFSILLIAVLAGVVYLLGPRGLKTSIYESKYKYKVAQWLEEIARALPTFKLAGTTNLAIEKMDELVTVYLKKRKAHFNVLVYQYLAIVIFKTLIVGGLLILGAYLVVERQITLGQFVASKLVLLLVMSSVEKVILTFDVVYDVLTAADKVGHVTDLPLDQNRGLTLDQRNPKGIGLTIRHLSYKYADGQGKVLNGIDLDVRPGERVAVIGSSGAGKTTFMNVVSGLYCDYEGVIAADSFSLRDLNLNAYRNQLGLNCTAEDVFDGTLLDNLTLGRKTITTSQLVKAVEVALLQDFLHSLPEGLNTRIVAGGQQLPTHIAKKIVLARNLLSDARMLLFDDFFTQLEEGEKNKLVRSLFSHDNGYREWTIVSVSNDPYVLSYCDRIVALDKGKVYKVGTLEDMLQDDFCRDLIPLPIASS